MTVSEPDQPAFVPLLFFKPRRLEDKPVKGKRRKLKPHRTGPKPMKREPPPEIPLSELAARLPAPEPQPEDLVALTQTTPEDPLDMEIAFRSPFPSNLDQFSQDLGGREAFLKACCLVPSKKVQKMLQRYKDLPKKVQQKVPFEHLCLQVDIEPEALVGNIVASLWKRHIDVSRLVNSSSLVEVMKSSIAVAKKKTYDAIEERRLQFEIAGLIKGSGAGINIFNQNVQKTGAPGFESEAKSSVLDGEFESLEGE